MLPFSISELIRGENETKIPIPEEKKKEEEIIPEAKINYASVTDEMKNAKVDCAKFQDKALYYKNEKTACYNSYVADMEKVKNDLAGGKYSRMAFYGKYSIYNCPVNPVKKIDNLAEGCLESAKFFDDYLFQKMASIYSTAGPRYGFFDKRLNVYIEESEKVVTEYCKSPAIGCSKDSTILLPLGTSNNKFYPEGRVYTVGFNLRDYSSNVYKDYLFQSVYPKNCILPQYTMHELIHYFDKRVYGRTPSWFEESMDYIVTDELTNFVCPPGLKYNVFKYDGNKMETFDDFDINSDDFLLYIQDKRYENNACRKAIVTQINQLFNEGKWTYFAKFYHSMDGKVKYDYYHEIPTKDIAAAVYESSGNDPAVRKYLYDMAKCPK